MVSLQRLQSLDIVFVFNIDTSCGLECVKVTLVLPVNMINYVIILLNCSKGQDVV